MSFTIKDGAGTGNVAKVDSNNRLHAESVSQAINEKATEDGDSYNINTGLITLTSANESACLYFKNNEEQDFHVNTIVVFFGASTSGTGEGTWRVKRNPTAGTIVSGATNVDINSNRNFGSSKTLQDSLAYKGAEANTMTDGTDHILIGQFASSRVAASIDEFIPKGSSLGVDITPPTSNTSMDVYVALIGYLVDPANE